MANCCRAGDDFVVRVRHENENALAKYGIHLCWSWLKELYLPQGAASLRATIKQKLANKQS
jgi:hypothetical protein